MFSKQLVKILVSNELWYDIELKDRITIIGGESATGKTTMCEFIRDSSDETLDIEIISERPCVFIGNTDDWEYQIKRHEYSILFIDEECKFISEGEFTKVVKQTTNMYVLCTRVNLINMPTSVISFVELNTNGKVHTFRQLYELPAQLTEPGLIVTEDSQSGYTFFLKVAEVIGAKCVSSNGNQRITQLLDDITTNNPKSKICVVADLAAIAPYISPLIRLIKERALSVYFLPIDSFESVLIKSYLVKDLVEADKVLSPLSYYTEDMLNNEQYYTRLLLDCSQVSKSLQYKKSKLKVCYYEDCCGNYNKCEKHFSGVKVKKVLGDLWSYFRKKEQKKFDVPRINLFD